MPLTVSLKAIKPKKINVKAMVAEILKEMKKETLIHRQLLGKTVSTWKQKPTFKTDVSLLFDSLVAFTHPAGNEKGIQRFAWVNNGVAPHIIRPKRAGVLRFRTGYVAASTVGKFRSGRSFRFGPRVSAKIVRHSGIQARGWTTLIVERRQPKFETRMIKAMRKAANKAF